MSTIQAGLLHQKKKTTKNKKQKKKRRKRLFTPSHEKLQHLPTTSNTSLETDAFK